MQSHHAGHPQPSPQPAFFSRTLITPLLLLWSPELDSTEKRQSLITTLLPIPPQLCTSHPSAQGCGSACGQCLISLLGHRSATSSQQSFSFEVRAVTPLFLNPYTASCTLAALCCFGTLILPDFSVPCPDVHFGISASRLTAFFVHIS